MAGVDLDNDKPENITFFFFFFDKGFSKSSGIFSPAMKRKSPNKFQGYIPEKIDYERMDEKYSTNPVKQLFTTDKPTISTAASSYGPVGGNRKRSAKRRSRSRSKITLKRKTKRQSRSKSPTKKTSTVPNLVKVGALSRHYYNNDVKRNHERVIDVKNTDDIRVWKNKTERDAHMKKIKDAIVFITKGWFGKNACDSKKSDMYVEYPYFDMRSCLKIVYGQPIPIPNHKFLKTLQSQFGGPLEVVYKIGNIVKY